MQRQEDWHAYLGLSPQAPQEQIAQAVERLSLQAAALAVTAPERSQRLRDTIRLIKRDLLSGQENRQRYDLGLGGRDSTGGTGGACACRVGACLLRLRRRGRRLADRAVSAYRLDLRGVRQGGVA